MSQKLTVVKVLGQRKPYHGEYNGRKYSIYEADVDCTVDGEEHQKAVVKSGKEEVIGGLAEGQTFWTERQDRKGFISWKLENRCDGGQPSLFSGASGGTGGTKFSGGREKAITAQSSIKAAVDLVIAFPDMEKNTDADILERVKKFAADLVSWVEDQSK